MCRKKDLSFPRHKSGPVIASISHSRDARARNAFTKMTDQKKKKEKWNDS